MRGVRVELFRSEHVEPKGYEIDTPQSLAESYFDNDDLIRDTWIEGTFPVDANWPQSFSSELIDVKYFLKFTLDIARRRDKSFEIPIVLQGRRDRDLQF